MSLVAWSIIDVEFTESDDGIRTYSAVCEAVTDDVADNAKTVRGYALTAIPPWSQYSFGNDSDPWCLARRPKSIKRRAVEKNRRVWRVAIDFTNRPLGSDQENERDDPLDDPPDISGSYVRATKVATKDRHGQPVTNSSDEPVIPAPEIDDSRDTIVIELNTATINLQVRAAARDKVNSQTIWGLTARQLKLAVWSYHVLWRTPVHPYIRHHFELEVNLNGWDFKHIDQGFRTRFAQHPDGHWDYLTLMDAQDQPLREARLLDGEGQLLDAAADPVELTDELYDEYDFGDLPLPDPLPIPLGT